MSIPGRVHPLLLPLYIGNGFSSFTEVVHPLLQPLFSRKCPLSNCTLSKSIQNPPTQPEVPASSDSANSETPETPTASAWPNVSAQGFSMDRANSALWDDKMESPPPWSSDKVESPLWDTDMKDPSYTWDLDLSHQLAAKLLMIDDQPSQVLDQQMFGQNSITYSQDMSMADISAGLSMAISCPTNRHMPYRITITMLNCFTVAVGTEFSVKRAEIIKTVTEVRLGEPPPRTEYC